MPSVPSKIIADTVADASPTEAAGKRRAASHQKAKPRMDVTA
jgi:hypothetical protein